jgi:hypothetical protein
MYFCGVAMKAINSIFLTVAATTLCLLVQSVVLAQTPAPKRPVNTILSTATATLPDGCDLSNLKVGPLEIEGQLDSDPNKVFLNLDLKFEPGPQAVVNGQLRTLKKIRENMEIGFFRNWLVEGTNGLTADLNASLPDSCSYSKGATSGNVQSYLNPTFILSQTYTKRNCSSFDLPCGAPEVTCTGGDAGAAPSCSLPSCGWNGCSGGGCSGGRIPQLPTCTTSTKMCRSEQKIDVFSATYQAQYGLSLGVIGAPPDQKLTISNTLLKSDLNTSTGELLKLLDNIGLANALGITMKKFDPAAYLNTFPAIQKTGAELLLVPTANFIYMPTIRSQGDASWIIPRKSPQNTAPFGIGIKRDIDLPVDLACRVSSCIRKSALEGKLRLNSCS